MDLYKRLSERSELGKFHALMGYTYTPDKEYLIEEDTLATYPSTDVNDDE